MTEESDNAGKAGSSARKRRRKPRNALGKDAPLALFVSTSPACEPGSNFDRCSLRRMISFVPTPSAVNRTISARQTCFCAACDRTPQSGHAA